jgi:polar amino acid transport system permease protein
VLADLWAYASDNGPAIASGAAMTLYLTACAAVLGVTLGIALATARRSWPRVCGRLIGGYVEVVRDTPFIVQLFFVYFGLPVIGIRFDPFAAAVLTLTLNLGAYATEIMRAGFDAVPRGQQEAGRALGLHKGVIFFRILLPQAIATVYPALASQVVIAMLDSAVVSQIALRDLTFEGDLIQSRSFLAFQTYAVVTLLYLAMSLLVRRALGLGGHVFLKRAA